MSSYCTALKFWDGKHVTDSIVMAAATIAIFMMTPGTKTFVDGMSSHSLWAGLKQQLLPQETFFGVSVRRLAQGASSAPAQGPITGSITQAGKPAVK